MLGAIMWNPGYDNKCDKEPTFRLSTQCYSGLTLANNCEKQKEKTHSTYSSENIVLDTTAELLLQAACLTVPQLANDSRAAELRSDIDVSFRQLGISGHEIVVVQRMVVRGEIAFGRWRNMYFFTFNQSIAFELIQNVVIYIERNIRRRLQFLLANNNTLRKPFPRSFLSCALKHRYDFIV